MGMANSFAPIGNNRFTRKWGGSTADGVDPYISGYFFTHWSYLPKDLGTAVAEAGKRSTLNANSEIKQVLHSSCLGVTIPGGTVNKTEFTGLGGVKWSAPTNVEQDTSVSMKFLEFSTTPILDIFHGWVRMMRDYRTGVTMSSGISANAEGGGAYTKTNYSGTCYYWTTKPNGHTVEYFNCMTGLFPLKDPQDLFSSDITAYDKVEVDIDFSVDYMFREGWVHDRCVSLASTVHNHATVIDKDYGRAEPPA